MTERIAAHTASTGSLESIPHGVDPPKCPECASIRVWRAGFDYRNRSSPQRWLCRDCGHRFPQKKRIKPLKPLQSVDSEMLNSPAAYVLNCQVCVSRTKAMKNLVEEVAAESGLSTAATTLADAKTEFAEQLRRNGYSPDTIRQCVNYLKLFTRKGVNILQPEQIKAFIADQKWENHSKATAVTMYGIFAKAMHLQWTQPRYKYDQKIPFIPLRKEIDDLIAGTGKRTSIFLRTLKEIGCRVGEALRIKWIDIDFERSTISINQPEKNSLPRILPVSLTLMAILNTLPKENESVFNRSRNTVESNYRSQRNKLAVKLGNPRLKQIRLSTFRHFYATMLFAKTLNIVKVQQNLGHKNLKNTQIYTHLVNFESDEYDVQIAENLEEAKKLLEAGFDYITDMDTRKLFRRRK